MMSFATLLQDLRWVRKAVLKAAPLLAERGLHPEAMLKEIAKLEAGLLEESISLEQANDAIERLMLPVAVLGWEYETSDEPDVAPDEFWAALEAAAPKAPSPTAAAG